MHELKIFEKEEFGSVRTIEENGKVLFCGRDVAEALGYSNPRDALSKHCRGVAKRDILTAGGAQSFSFIPFSKQQRDPSLRHCERELCRL